MEETKIAVISDFYGRKQIIDTLNSYFSTTRFFYKYGLTRGCFDIFMEGKLEKTEIEKFRYFINGLMVGINLG